MNFEKIRQTVMITLMTMKLTAVITLRKEISVILQTIMYFVQKRSK